MTPLLTERGKTAKTTAPADLPMLDQVHVEI